MYHRVYRYRHPRRALRSRTAWLRRALLYLHRRRRLPWRASRRPMRRLLYRNPRRALRSRTAGRRRILLYVQLR